MRDLFERVLLPTAPADTAMGRLLATLPKLSDAVQRRQDALGPSAHARIAFEAADRDIYAHTETIEAALATLGAHLDAHPALLALRLRLRPSFRPQWGNLTAEKAASMPPPAVHGPGPNTLGPQDIGRFAWQWHTDRATAHGSTGEQGKKVFHLGGPAYTDRLNGEGFQAAYTALVALLDAFALRAYRPGGERRKWIYRTSFRTGGPTGTVRLTGALDIHQRCMDDAALVAMLMNVPILEVAEWQAAGGRIALTAGATRKLPEQTVTLAPRLCASGPFFVLHTEQP